MRESGTASSLHLDVDVRSKQLIYNLQSSVKDAHLEQQTLRSTRRVGKVISLAFSTWRWATWATWRCAQYRQRIAPRRVTEEGHEN